MRSKKSDRAEFAEKIREWHKQNRREFSWRRTRDPYKILIAEMLLRKTTAEQVEKIFERFIRKYPGPAHLAKASKRELNKLIEPLGMKHKRMVLLKKLGRVIVEKHGGKVPNEMEKLIALPGVGMYAANAVLCLAHGQDVAMVDTNIARVVTRFFGFETCRTRPKDDLSLWSFVESLIPRGMGKELNLALLDFGSMVCMARNPGCAECVVQGLCHWRKTAE